MKVFEQLDIIEDVDRFISEEGLSFLYVSRPNCSVCHGLFPQVQQLMEKYENIKLGHVDAEIVPEIAGHFSVYTVPVLLLFIDGKEYLREARFVHMDLFEEKLDKIYENVVRLQ